MKNLFVFFSLLIFLSSCEKYGVVKYPEQGKTGDNILSLDQTVYSGELSMTASFNSKGSSEVEIESLNIDTSEEKWSYYVLDNKHWNFYGSRNNSQKFISKIGARKPHPPLLVGVDVCM